MPRSMPVSQVMTTDVLTFSPDDTVEACAHGDGCCPSACSRQS